MTYASSIGRRRPRHHHDGLRQGLDPQRRRGEDGRLGTRAREREQADQVRQRHRPQLLRVQHADGADRGGQLLERLRRRRLHLPPHRRLPARRAMGRRRVRLGRPRLRLERRRRRIPLQGMFLSVSRIYLSGDLIFINFDCILLENLTDEIETVAASHQLHRGEQGLPQQVEVSARRGEGDALLPARHGPRAAAPRLPARLQVPHLLQGGNTIR